MSDHESGDEMQQAQGSYIILQQNNSIISLFMKCVINSFVNILNILLTLLFWQEMKCPFRVYDLVSSLSIFTFSSV